MMGIQIVREGVDGTEIDVHNKMVEDAVGGPSYVDYLISMHRIVQQEVIGNNVDEAVSRTLGKMVFNKSI